MDHGDEEEISVIEELIVTGEGGEQYAYAPFDPDTRLGKGGYSEVWLARRIGGQSEPRVALKLFKPAVSQRCIQREIFALRRLRYQVGIVQLLDVIKREDGQVRALVLEYIEGQTWEKYFKIPRPWSRVRYCMEQLLEIMTGVHEAGLIHRDLKPSNIMIDPEGWLTVLDFGVCIPSILGEEEITRQDGDARSSIPGEEEITRQGSFVGTISFLHPEVASMNPGTREDPGRDVYAVGVILFMTLTGKGLHDRPSRKTVSLAEAWSAAVHDPGLTEGRTSLLPDSLRGTPEGAAVRGLLGKMIHPKLRELPSMHGALQAFLAIDHNSLDGEVSTPPSERGSTSASNDPTLGAVEEETDTQVDADPFGVTLPSAVDSYPSPRAELPALPAIPADPPVIPAEVPSWRLSREWAVILAVCIASILSAVIVRLLGP